MARTKAPTAELGAPGITSSIDGWLDTYETTPELTWPNNIRVYDHMRKDGHLSGGLRAITLPIRRTHWDLAPDSLNDVRPEVIQLVRRDLGIAEKGSRLRRPRGGVVFADVLRHALLELVFGHMLFEQVYELTDGAAHLRKLAPRMPRTICGWDVDARGTLRAVKQLVARDNGFWDDVTIPIDRLVVFTHEKEGSDPTGQSLLRPAYIHWTMKQALIKVDAMAAERNGMGVAQFTYDAASMKRSEALDIASNVRAGEYAGLAIEQGTGELELKGVTGAVREILPSIKYHDQEMGRLMLAMFMDLGQDNGARSLGDTFVDFFVMSLQAVADHIADVLTEYVIRDLVEINYGPDEPYPVLTCDEITGDTDLTADALKALADGGYILPDLGIENALRKRYGFPAAADHTAPAPAPALEPPVVDRPASEGDTIARLQARFDRLTAGPRAVPTRVPSGP